MNRIAMWFCAIFVLSFCTVGCADMTRKLDVAIYGSEEEADAAHAQYVASELKRNEKKARKLAEEARNILREERRKHRLFPTIDNKELREVAKIRSNEIVSNYSADRPNGLHSFSLYEDFSSLTKVRPIRELRAKGPQKPREVINYWFSRENEKKVLIGPRIYSTAVGLTIVGSTYYWVLVAYEQK